MSDKDFEQKRREYWTLGLFGPKRINKQVETDKLLMKMWNNRSTIKHKPYNFIIVDEPDLDKILKLRELEV